MTEEPVSKPLDQTLTGAFDDHRTFFENISGHVEALRSHLLRMLICLIITVGAAFFFTQRIADYLADPIGGLAVLKAIEVTESVGVFMRVALLAGIAVAMPYLAFEAWWFIAPGVSPRMRRLSLVSIPMATLLFLGGMAFAYYLMLPTALPFLRNFMGIPAEWQPKSYFNFVTGLMFWIGAFFEFPLIVFILAGLGVVRPRALAEQWRLAVVVIAVMSAVITPTIDPVNMGLVMLPMILLYFVSIVLGQAAYAARRRRIVAAEQASAQEGCV